MPDVFMILSDTIAPSLADIEALADHALGEIPPELRAMAAGVIIRVEDFPDEATCAEMDLDSPYELLGLYRGTSLTEKSVGDVATDVDMVFLYRRPILDEWCETGERLGDLVRNVLIHEIGHHFGLSDAQMEALEAADDEGRDEGIGDGG
jgi:predicted Zn-dependent protease with MMP-like domain